MVGGVLAVAGFLVLTDSPSIPYGPEVAAAPPPPESWQECADAARDTFNVVERKLKRVHNSDVLVHALGEMQYELAVCDRTFPEAAP